MNEIIEVKVNLREFTYRDKKGYHTVVGYGKVPSNNQAVKTAIEKGWIIPVKKESKSSIKKSLIKK